MGRSQGYVTKTHFLKQTHLGSLLEPANPSEADFTATKGMPLCDTKCFGTSLLDSLGVAKDSTHVVRRSIMQTIFSLHRLSVPGSYTFRQKATLATHGSTPDQSAVPVCSGCDHRAKLSGRGFSEPVTASRSHLRQM